MIVSLSQRHRGSPSLPQLHHQGIRTLLPASCLHFHCQLWAALLHFLFIMELFRAAAQCGLPAPLSTRGGNNISISHMVLPWTLYCQTCRDIVHCWSWCEMLWASMSSIRCEVLFPPSPSVVILWSILPYSPALEAS